MKFIIFLSIVFFILIYVAFGFLIKGIGSFADIWLKRTIWLWLPFYALYALLRDFSKKRHTRQG